MAEWLNLDHFDLGTFVDYVHALKQERDALRAQLPSQGGEVVEVVAWQDAENPLYTTAERRVMHDWAGNGYPIVELMTVAQHQRILAASTGSAEPVAWHTEDHLTDKSATTYDPEIAKRWRAKGWPVTPLYTHPADQLADDLTMVKVSRKLLERAARHLNDWLELDQCECEGPHYCGRTQVAATNRQLRAILEAKYE